MGLFQDILKRFIPEEKGPELDPAVNVPKSKGKEEIGPVIAPYFREIPPDSKARAFLTEGMRSWAFIAISAIADEICTNDISLYKRSGNDWLEVTDHQVLNTIFKPNDIQTKEELLWLMTVYLLAEGEAPILLNDSKNPTQMVLLNPEKIKIIYGEKNVISGYQYLKSNGQPKDLEYDNVLFVKLPSIHSPFRGMGIMKYIAQTLDIDKYIEEYLRMFFFNDATPGSVLETDKELSDIQYNRLVKKLEQKHRGYKKSHKNLILEGGLKWREVGMKLTELQIKDIQDAIRDKVLAAFKVPKSIVGIVEDVNRANGETSDRVFAKRCIRPKLKMIEAQLNQYFLPKFSEGKNLWFEFENPVKEDELIQAQVDQIYINSGILTVDEIRERMELPPLKKSDVVTEEQGKKMAKPNRANKVRGKEMKEVILEEKKTEESTLIDVLRPFAIIKKENKTVFTEEEKKEYHNKKIEFADKIEADFKKEVSGYFKKLENKVIKQVKSYRKKAINIDINEDEESQLMMEISIPFLEDTIIKESELAAALLNLDIIIDPQDKLVRDFIKERTLKLGKSTAKTTVSEIDTILKRWATEEGTIAELKSYLKEYFDYAQNDRAEMIARTEVSRAAGFAQEAVYTEAGAESKEWLTAEDEMVCEYCSEMQSKTASIGETFFDLGDSMMGNKGGVLDFGFEDIEGPPLHVNCRCDLIPVFNQTKNSDNFKEKMISTSKKLKQAEEMHKKAEEAIKKAEMEKEKIKQQEIVLSKQKKILDSELKDIEKIKKELDV